MRWKSPTRTAEDRNGESGSASVLHSWKEIAAYLKRGVRTVQRWETSEGLPVHRHPHEKRDSVYAFPAEIDAWWTSRRESLENGGNGAPETPPETLAAGRPDRRRWLWGGAAAAAMLSAGVAVWLGWGVPRFGSPALSFAKRDWVLVADFDNQTGDPLFNKSLQTAFTVSLEQSRHANVLPKTRIRAALRRMGRQDDPVINEQLGREICLRENTKGLITCAILRSGRAYALSARLIDPQTGAAVRSYYETAENQDRVLDALGKLTSRIRRDLGESLASIHENNEPLPLVTTASLPALRLYAEGNYLWRKGQYREAEKAFESALERDGNFAMAHVALGSAYLSHIFNAPALGREHFEKALRLKSRISDRERMYLEAKYQQNLGHVEEAATGYRLYLRSYPDDTAAHYDLGTLLMRNERETEALEEFRQLLRLTPANAGVWINLATATGQLKRTDEALGYYAKAFELEPSWVTLGNLNPEYAFLLVRAGQMSKARDTVGLAIAKPETKPLAMRTQALLDMYEGRYREARAHLREAAELHKTEVSVLAAARDLLLLAILLESAGDRSGAGKELDRAVAGTSTSPLPVWLLARIGAVYARIGEPDAAARSLGECAARADRKSPGDSGALNLLEGEAALARGEHARAIGKLRLAVQGVTLPLALDSLARAYRKAGDAGQAIECYERLLGLEHRVLGWEPQQAWFAAHAELAELYLLGPEKAKAGPVLDELAARWKNADRDHPLVERLKRLRRTLAADVSRR